VVVFWILLVAFIAWIPTIHGCAVWTVLGIGWLVVGFIYSVVEMSRRGYRTGEFSSCRGFFCFLCGPCWMTKSNEKRTSKAKELLSPDSKG
jgi:hypothetical protein